jgi:hypothetical protein
MRIRRRTRRLWSTWLLAVGLGTAPGCLTCCHPVAAPPKEQTETCQAISLVNRKCVYTFLLNGTDALGCANLQGVQKYLFDLGFTRTYYGEACHNAYFRDEIRRISQAEPDARFVLVGYDVGAKAACNVAKWVQCNDVHFDLIVYIDPLMLDEATCHPENAAEVIDVESGHGTGLDSLETVNVPDAGHFSVVTHSSTLCLLANQLTKIAGDATPPPPPEPVPVLEPTPTPMPPADEMAPTPRPLPPPAPQTSRRGEWDFLKPTDQLQPEPTQVASTPAVQRGDWHQATAPFPNPWGRYPAATHETPPSH